MKIVVLCVAAVVALSPANVRIPVLALLKALSVRMLDTCIAPAIAQRRVAETKYSFPLAMEAQRASPTEKRAVNRHMWVPAPNFPLVRV